MNALAIRPLALFGVGVAALAIGFGSGWTANGWRLGAGLSELKAAHAGEREKQSVGVLSTLQADAKAVQHAAAQLAVLQDALDSKINSLKTELKNAKPLPFGCHPDDGRMRNLDAAIDAANAAATGR